MNSDGKLLLNNKKTIHRDPVIFGDWDPNWTLKPHFLNIASTLCGILRLWSLVLPRCLLGGEKVIAIHCGWVYEGLNYGPYLTIEEQIALKPTKRRTTTHKKSSEQKSISIHTIQFSVGPKLPPKKSKRQGKTHVTRVWPFSKLVRGVLESNESFSRFSHVRRWNCRDYLQREKNHMLSELKDLMLFE